MPARVWIICMLVIKVSCLGDTVQPKWRNDRTFTTSNVAPAAQVAAGDTEECGAKTIPLTLTLKRRLLCNYDPEVRPVKAHTNITDVKYTIFPSSMFFHEDTNFLEIRTWVEMNWRDEHLTWDKNEYGGLEVLTIRCDRIWMPDVALTSGSTPTPTQEAGHCLVKQDGSVRAGMPVTHMVGCVPDITMWPFDTHNCTMRVSSWIYYSDKINLTTGNSAVFVNTFTNGRNWHLLQGTSRVYTRVYPPPRNITWPCISYSFLMQRHSGSYVATVVTPGVVLAILTLVTFWMDPTESQRMDLIRINVLCHCMYMIYLGMKLPGNGDKTPLIITFFRDSFLLAVVSLLVTLFAAGMKKAVRAPPAWIACITKGMMAQSVGQVLLLGELNPKVAARELSAVPGDGISLVEETHAAQGWRLLATLLDRICFLVFTISLVVLLSAFIPRE